MKKKLKLISFFLFIAHGSPVAAEVAPEALRETTRLAECTTARASKWLGQMLVVRRMNVIGKPFLTNPGFGIFTERGVSKEVVVNELLNREGSIVEAKVKLIHGNYEGVLATMKYFIPDRYDSRMDIDLAEEMASNPVLILENCGAKSLVDGFHGYVVRDGLPDYVVEGPETFTRLESLIEKINAKRMDRDELNKIAIGSNDVNSIVAINEILTRNEIIDPDIASSMLRGKNAKLRSVILLRMIQKNRLDEKGWKTFGENLRSEFGVSIADQIGDIIKRSGDDEKKRLNAIVEALRATKE